MVATVDHYMATLKNCIYALPGHHEFFSSPIIFNQLPEYPPLRKGGFWYNPSKGIAGPCLQRRQGPAIPNMDLGRLKLQPTLLRHLFPFLLVLDVSSDLLGIEPNRVGAVTFDPKVIAPIGPTF